MPEENLDEMTIVIQGRVVGECIRHMVSKYRENVVISTWEGESLDDCGNLDGVRVIKSPIPVSNIGPTNMMLQFNSTIAGLSICDTKYAIKMRGDEYFSNIDMVNQVVKKDDRIHCIPVFMPRHSARPYCIGDHFLAGETTELASMFMLAKKWWETFYTRRIPRIIPFNQIPECILGACHIHKKSEGNMKPDLMKKYFSIMDLDKLKDYRITWNNSVRFGKKSVYYNDFDPEKDGRGSVVDINQITEQK